MDKFLSIIFLSIFVSTYKSDAQQRCYSCSSVDANELLNQVQDETWRRWLDNIKSVPNTRRCSDLFVPELSLRAGVRSEDCSGGICMKMWFRKRGGIGQVWRSCIPNAADQIRQDCTRISSSQGDLEVCTCAGNLCNSALLKNDSLFLILSLTGILALFLCIFEC